jgi:hypothetical protein
MCYSEVHHNGSEWFIVNTFEYLTTNHTWYTLRISIRGDHTECFLRDGENEMMVFPFTDGRFATGCIGLRIVKSAYRFKNIKVTAPDGKVLWEGMPALP